MQVTQKLNQIGITNKIKLQQKYISYIMRKLGVSMPNSEQTNKLSEFMPVLRQLRSAACNGDKTKDVFTNKSARKETG